MNITIGRTVLYTLSKHDANQVNWRRTNSAAINELTQLGVRPRGA